MTVSSSTTRWNYTGNGVTVGFAYTTRIFDNTDLKVYVAGTLKTLTSHYTVSGVDEATGGTVTFLSAPANNAEVVIVRDVPRTQSTNLPALGLFPAENVEEALDRAMIIDQQLSKRIDRTLRQPTTDVSDMAELPAKADRAGLILTFDTNGDPTAAGTPFPTSLTATYIPRVNSGGTAYELRTQAQTRSDIGADNASNLTSGTLPDARLSDVVTAATKGNGTSQTLVVTYDAKGRITGVNEGGIEIAGSQVVSGTIDNARLDAQLQDVAGLAVTDGNFIVGNGTNFVAESGATARASLGLTIGTDVQAYHARLADVAAVGVTDNAVLIGNGSNLVLESGATLKTSLGLTIGTDVQAYSANLDEYAAVNPTAAGLALLDDAAASDQRTTLGLGTVATLNTGTGSGNVPLVGTASATESLAGLAELATQAEVDAGTDTARSVTPATLKTNAWSFRAHKNGTDQTGIASTTFTKLTFTTESFDIGGYYDAANSKLLPTVGGTQKWRISACAQFTANVGANFVYAISIYKNGAEIARGSSIGVSSAGVQAPVQVTDVVTLNGSTDYIEIYVYGEAASDKTIEGDAHLAWFSGEKIG